LTVAGPVGCEIEEDFIDLRGKLRTAMRRKRTRQEDHGRKEEWRREAKGEEVHERYNVVEPE
jgi:hypothetical protein